MADPAGSVAVDPIYAPSPDMIPLLQRLGLVPQTGAAATAAQPPPASAAVTAAPRLVRPQAPVVQAPATPQPPVAPQVARTQVPTISLPHDPYGLVPASSDPAVVEPMLDQIRDRESGNRNIREIGGGPASGLYQIEPPTWNDFNWGYKQYKEAIDAPPDVQREVARRIFAARGEAAWLASNPTYKRLHGQAADPANSNLSPDLGGLVQSLPPEMQAALAQKYANDQRLEQSLVEKQNQQTAIVNAMLKDVPPSYGGTDPALHAPPPTPDIQPIKAFQNWGVALAMLGSLLTRRPLTAALKAGGAAMNAYNKGQWQEYYAQRQNWQDNVDLAMKQNELEYRRYEAAAEQYKFNHEKLLDAYTEIANIYGDKVALHDIENGHIDDFLQMRKQLLDEGYKLAALNMRYNLGYGGMTPAQRMHDDRIQQAREELKAQGIDYKNLKWPSTLQRTGGQLSDQDRRNYTLYNIANQPLYADMFRQPGTADDTSSEQSPAAGPIPITPDMVDKDGNPLSGQPDGTPVHDNQTNTDYVKQGDHLVPKDQYKPASAAAKPDGGGLFGWGFFGL